MPRPVARREGDELHDSIRSKWLPRMSRARLLAAAVLVGGVLVAGSPISSASSASAGPAATTAAGEGVLLNVLDDPHEFRVAYGIQPLLTAGSTAVARR